MADEKSTNVTQFLKEGYGSWSRGHRTFCVHVIAGELRNVATVYMVDINVLIMKGLSDELDLWFISNKKVGELHGKRYPCFRVLFKWSKISFDIFVGIGRGLNFLHAENLTNCQATQAIL